MSLTIPIETSARHIHLSQEDFETLFGPGAELTYVKELSQPGQYACRERLTVVGPKGSFENVIVLGPCRSKTQVEVSVTDNRKLGIPSVMVSDGPHGLRKQDDKGDHLGINESIKAVCFPPACLSACLCTCVQRCQLICIGTMCNQYPQTHLIFWN